MVNNKKNNKKEKVNLLKVPELHLYHQYQGGQTHPTNGKIHY